jgi:hypothetical protein
MHAEQFAALVLDRLGPGSAVTVARAAGNAFDLKIEWRGSTYFRSVVGESSAALDAALADRIAAGLPR